MSMIRFNAFSTDQTHPTCNTRAEPKSLSWFALCLFRVWLGSTRGQIMVLSGSALWVRLKQWSVKLTCLLSYHMKALSLVHSKYTRRDVWLFFSSNRALSKCIHCNNKMEGVNRITRFSTYKRRWNEIFNCSFSKVANVHVLIFYSMRI